MNHSETESAHTSAVACKGVVVYALEVWIVIVLMNGACRPNGVKTVTEEPVSSLGALPRPSTSNLDRLSIHIRYVTCVCQSAVLHAENLAWCGLFSRAKGVNTFLDERIRACACELLGRTHSKWSAYSDCVTSLWPTSSGVDCIHYRLVDAISDPVDTQQWHSEKLW